MSAMIALRDSGDGTVYPFVLGRGARCVGIALECDRAEV
jgi:hypothetical protein